MKKFLKFICGAASMAAVAFGAYCVYKKVTDKEEDDEDFEDCFEDEEEETTPGEREYVSINITAETPSEEGTEDVEENTSEAAETETEIATEE